MKQTEIEFVYSGKLCWYSLCDMPDSGPGITTCSVSSMCRIREWSLSHLERMLEWTWYGDTYDPDTNITGIYINLSIDSFPKNNVQHKTLCFAIHWYIHENWKLVRHCDLVESVHTWDRTGCEFDSWQCRIYIISHVHRAHDYSGPFGVLWVHIAWYKNCVKKISKQ